MLTNRLKLIKENLLSQRILSTNEKRLIGLINKIDEAEQNISTAIESRDKDLLVEMIVRPGGNKCNICGRTL